EIAQCPIVRNAAERPTMSIRSLAVAGAAVVLFALPLLNLTYAKLQVRCMTDDGYGRYRPCDAGFKAQHPDWRSSEYCMTDDGNGGYRTCSAEYKAKHAK